MSRKDAIENNIRTNQSKKTSFIKKIFNTICILYKKIITFKEKKR